MGGIQQPEDGVVLGIVRPTMYIARREQREVIERYVKGKGLGRLVLFEFETWRNSWYRLVSLKRVLDMHRPRVAVVYDWAVMGVACNIVSTLLTILFQSGVEEIHNARTGEKLTAEDWLACKRVMLLFVKQHRRKLDPRAVAETLKYVPLNSQEAKDIYDAIKRSEGHPIIASRSTYSFVVNAIDILESMEDEQTRNNEDAKD